MRRWAILLALALCTPAVALARRPAPPTGTLALPLPDPVVTATVEGVSLRLRVVLDGRNVVTLNRAAVTRLPIAFEKTASADIGRERLPGIAAPATLLIAGRPVATSLWSYGDCCDGVDGAIDAALLPYAQVRLVRDGMAGGTERTFTMRRDDDHGMSMRETVNGHILSIQFSLDRQETLATAASGAMLADAWGGRFVGGYTPVLVAWGVSRPSRILAFTRPASLAGFRVAAIRTRTADFAGQGRLPTDPATPGEILVRRKVRPQYGWPVVAIGRDRLDRCGELRLDTQMLLLTLRCDAPA